MTAVLRYRLSEPEPEPQAEPKKPAAPAAPPALPLRLNRWRSEKTGRWLCNLPGDDRIQYRLPADAPAALRRLPTGFDMNVLFRLLAERQHADADELVFPSEAALLRALDMFDNHQNGKRLRSALDLWQNLTVRWKRWWERGRHVTKVMPPPIRELRRQGRRLVIVLDPAWAALGEGYYEPVWLPQPNAAAVQNLILVALTSAVGHSESVKGVCRVDTTPAWPRRALCRAIGLNHNLRNQQLPRVAATACGWFLVHGGALRALMTSPARVSLMAIDWHSLKIGLRGKGITFRRAPIRQILIGIAT